MLSVGVPWLYGGQDLRLSYVTWQEGKGPEVVVEFLSPGTEREDLGRFFRPADILPTVQPPLPSASPPGKLEVYERYLQVPHYTVCGLGVLPVKPLHLRQGKVVQGEGLHLDVEGAGTMEAIAAPRRHLIVPHIPHANQGDTLGKALGPQGIARAQLPQQGDQGLIPQGIHLVHKYYQGTGAGLRP
jgi:hypothetical protein